MPPFQPPSYFFGTIHVPYTRVWDAVSANTKKAFKAADKVALPALPALPAPEARARGFLAGIASSPWRRRYCTAGLLVELLHYCHYCAPTAAMAGQGQGRAEP